MDVASLEPGSLILCESIEVSNETCFHYREAVDDRSSPGGHRQFAHPMAVLALLIGRTMETIGLPPGSIHTNQDIEFFGAIQVDSTIDGTGSVVANNVRQGTRFLILELSARYLGTDVLIARSTIAVPEERSAS